MELKGNGERCVDWSDLNGGEVVAAPTFPQYETPIEIVILYIAALYYKQRHTHV